MWILILEILIPIGVVSAIVLIIETIKRQIKSLYYRKMEKAGLKLAEELEVELKSGREKPEEVERCLEYLTLSRKKLTLSKNVNRFHTIENYKNAYILDNIKHKFSKKMVLYKNLLSDKFNPNLITSDFIKPDWVREVQLSSDSSEYDNRTYIQCFHRGIADEFKEYFENYYIAKKLSPYVGELRFNCEKSDLKPFRVSCPDRLVYEKGLHLLVGLVQEVQDKNQNFNMQVFPINIREYGNYKGKCLETEIKDFQDLNKFSDELNMNVINMENERNAMQSFKDDELQKD